MTNQLQHSAVQSCGGDIRQFPDQSVRTHMFDERSDRITPGAMDRIDSPMAELAAFVHHAWTLRDVSLTWQAAAALLGGVALSPLLGSLPQKEMQRSASMLVSPHVLADRLVADADVHPVSRPRLELGSWVG